MGKFALLVSGEVIEIESVRNRQYVLKGTNKKLPYYKIKALGSNRTILLCYRLSLKK